MAIDAGRLSIDGGRLAIDGTATIAAGADIRTTFSFFAGNNAAVTLNGTVTGGGGVNAFSGSWTLASTSTFTPNGLGIAGNTFTANIPVAVPVVSLFSGRYLGPADLTVPAGGTMTWNDTEIEGASRLVVAAGGTLLVPEGSHVITRSIVNNGTVRWTAGFFEVFGASQPDGNLTITNNGLFEAILGGGETMMRWRSGNRPRFDNTATGTLRKLGTGTFSTDLTVSNAGVIDAVSGTSSLNGPVTNLSGTTLTGGAWSVADGATLRLAGADIRTNAADITLDGPNSRLFDTAGQNALRNLATNNGTLSLAGGRDLSVAALANNGTLALSPGSLATVTGDYTQAGSGRLNVVLNGSVHGQLAVDGTAALDGALGLGGAIEENTSALVVDAPTRTGAFATVASGWEVSYVPAGVQVRLGDGGDEGDDVGAALDQAYAALLLTVPDWAGRIDFAEALAAAGELANPLAGLTGDVDDIVSDGQVRGCTVLPNDADDVIRLRCTQEVGSLTVSRDLFLGGVLQGVAESVNLDAGDAVGTLTATVVLGVDASGSFVDDETALSFEIDPTGPLTGSADVGGVAGVSLAGSLDGSVAVVAPANPALAVTPSGAVDVDVDLSVFGAALHWEASYRVGGPTGDPALTGSFRLPGLELDPGSEDPFVLTLAGAPQGDGWRLEAVVADETTLRLAGFAVEDFALAFTVSPTAFAASGGATVLVGDDLNLSVAFSIEEGAFSITGTLDPPAAITIGALSCAVPDGLSFSLAGEGDGPVFSIPTTQCTIAAIDGFTVTITDLHLNRDGTFGAGSADTTIGEAAGIIGLAGVLPFALERVCVAFPDSDDLSTFQIAVDGALDADTFAGWSVTPVLELGDAGTAVEECGEGFDFSVTQDLEPYDLGPITLGFTGLQVGTVTMGGQITLGGYEDGDFNGDEFGGTATIEGGLDVVDGEATVNLEGGYDDETGALQIDAEFVVTADFGAVARIEDAVLQFGLGLDIAESGFVLTGPTFTGAEIGSLVVHFGDFMDLVTPGPQITFAPGPGEAVFSTDGGGVEVHFHDSSGPLAGWTGSAGSFELDADLVPRALPGFFVKVDPPHDERFGLPDFIPIAIHDVQVSFPDLDDLSRFRLRLSGGMVATDEWPIDATFEGLEVSAGASLRRPAAVPDHEPERRDVRGRAVRAGAGLQGGRRSQAGRDHRRRRDRVLRRGLRRVRGERHRARRRPRALAVRPGARRAQGPVGGAARTDRADALRGEGGHRVRPERHRAADDAPRDAGRPGLRRRLLDRHRQDQDRPRRRHRRRDLHVARRLHAVHRGGRHRDRRPRPLQRPSHVGHADRAGRERRRHALRHRQHRGVRHRLRGRRRPHRPHGAARADARLRVHGAVARQSAQLLHAGPGRVRDPPRHDRRRHRPHRRHAGVLHHARRRHARGRAGPVRGEPHRARRRGSRATTTSSSPSCCWT